MYQITQNLLKAGFSINKLSTLIDRNSNLRTFSSLEYFCICVIVQDHHLIIDNKAYFVKGGNAVFLAPQKNITFEDGGDDEIYVIAFSACFFERSSEDSLFLYSTLFFNCKENVFIAPYFLNEEFMKVVLIERLEAFKAKSESLYISAAHHTIGALILDAFLHADFTESEKNEKLEYVFYVNRFRVLLQRDFKSHKKVSYYADKLNVSTRKLTEMAEYVTGKTAKQIIIEKIVNEWEKSRKFSSLTISEISFDLGFNDEGNFSNFIKKHSGKSPSGVKSIS